MKPLLIRNVRIIFEDRIAAGAVLVKDGLIAGIERNGESQLPPGCETFDGKGLYLSPGFIDVHNHGRLGVNVMDGPEALETAARGQAQHGVTAFLAGTATRPWEDVLEAARSIAAYCERTHQDGMIQNGAGAFSSLSQCLGIYSESCFFSEEKRGAHRKDWLLPPDRERINALMEAGGKALLIAALSPELPGAPEAVSILRSAGIAVAAAHSSASWEETLAGIDAGITLATHTFNGMKSLHHQEPGILGAVLNDSRVFCEIIADGIHLAPPILSLVYKLKGPGRTVLVSDSVEPNGLPEGVYEKNGYRITVRDGSIRLDDGRLAGSCLSLDRAVRNMVRLAGVPLHDAVAMASLSPAKVTGLDGKKGSIAAGKDADLVLFDEDVSVKAVFIRGLRL